MGRADHYRHGSNNVICDRCGFKFKAESVRHDGNNRGLIVCNQCYDPYHPQRMVRGKHDDQRPKISRPEGADTFVSTPITQDDL